MEESVTESGKLFDGTFVHVSWLSKWKVINVYRHRLRARGFLSSELVFLHFANN